MLIQQKVHQVLRAKPVKLCETELKDGWFYISIHFPSYGPAEMHDTMRNPKTS